jgi:hypothetical protein
MWRWVVSFTSWSLYHLRKFLGTLWKGGCAGTSFGVDAVKKTKSLAPVENRTAVFHPVARRHYYSVGATVHDKHWPLFYSFLIKQRVGRLSWAWDQSSARPLLTQDNTNTKQRQIDIHASSGIRTHSLIVWAGEDRSCLREPDRPWQNPISCIPSYGSSQKQSSLSEKRPFTITYVLVLQLH